MNLTDHISPITSAIYEQYERIEGAEPARTYLGASQIGKECERALWYSFRWAAKEQFEGRMLRLFQTGHLAEARFVADLRRIGAEVFDVDPATGKQFGFQDHGGHMRGHMDGCVRNFPSGGGKWHVTEFKTHSSKSFKTLQKEGVEKAKPEHFAQMQWYMGKSGMQRALYLAVNKDTDELYAERLKFDEVAFARIQAKAERIIFTDTPPPKLSDNPKFWQCNFCTFQKVCHHQQTPAASCRTCCHSTPEPHGDGRWSCAKDQDKNISSIPIHVQRTGCKLHLTNPNFISFAKPLDAGEDWIMLERLDTGEQFAMVNEVATDAPLTKFIYTSREVAAGGSHALICHPAVEDLKSQFPGATIC